MMTSSNGNIFRVTEPFVSEIHRSPVDSPHMTQGFDVFYDVHPDKGLANSRSAGVLRRHDAHSDVTVVRITIHTIELEVSLNIYMLKQ